MLILEKRTLKRVAAAAVFATAMAGAHAQPAGINASRILIGQSAPLTGANAELGNDIRNGALAYFRRVNEAGGVHGRKIELVSLDDGNTVPKAEANTRKLIEEDGVVALFGYASATLSRPLGLCRRAPVAPGAAVRGQAQGAVPRAVHRRRPDARVPQARVQHARQLCRRARQDGRPIRAARGEALVDRVLR